MMAITVRIMVGVTADAMTHNSAHNGVLVMSVTVCW